MSFRKKIIAYMHLFSALSIYPLHAFALKVGVQAAFATLLFIYITCNARKEPYSFPSSTPPPIHLTSALTCISRNPNALPMAVAVKSLPPLPNVVTAHDLQPYNQDFFFFFDKYNREYKNYRTIVNHHGKLIILVVLTPQVLPIRFSKQLASRRPFQGSQ